MRAGFVETAQSTNQINCNFVSLVNQNKALNIQNDYNTAAISCAQ